MTNWSKLALESEIALSETVTDADKLYYAVQSIKFALERVLKDDFSAIDLTNSTEVHGARISLELIQRRLEQVGAALASIKDGKLKL